MPKPTSGNAKKVFLDTQFVEWDDFGELTATSPNFIRYESDVRGAYRSVHAIGTLSRLMNALHTERAHADDSAEQNYMCSISDHATEAMFYAIEELSNRARECMFRVAKEVAADLKGSDA